MGAPNQINAELPGHAPTALILLDHADAMRIHADTTPSTLF